MPAPILIELTDEARKEPHQRCRIGKTAVRVKERPSIVLLADEGLTNTEIAEHVPRSAHAVGRWRKRFSEEGLAGIEKNKPRGLTMNPSKNAEYAKLRQQIIEITTREKPEGATHGCTRTLAEKLGIHSSFVSQVCRDNGLTPHLVKSFKVSNDPNFEEKLATVVGLYMNPPENAAVFCVDEKSSILALDRTQPGLPMKKGRAGRYHPTLTRRGSASPYLQSPIRIISNVALEDRSANHKSISLPELVIARPAELSTRKYKSHWAVAVRLGTNFIRLKICGETVPAEESYQFYCFSLA